MEPINYFIHSLEALFEDKANATIAAKNKAYMKHHFSFTGLKTAERRSMTTILLKEIPLTNIESVEQLVRKLYLKPEREYHHAAIQILGYYKKYWQPETLALLEFCLINQSWWDSVDNLNAECVSEYFLRFPGEIHHSTRWNKQENMWLQRSSIIFQKGYKNKTNSQLLANHILNLASSKEFFIQKAIGWALREYAKTNKDWVLDFAANNKLPPLSKREALKHFV